MKRFLSLLMVAVMVLSMIPAVSFAAEERTVWVDAQNGSDDNSGLTEAAPVKTLATAYAALSGADAGRVVFLGTTSFSGAYTFPKHTIPVTLTSKTGAEGLRSGYNLYFGGPTTLENITVTCTSANAWTLLCGNGHKFVVGDNVTSLETNSYRFCLQGAANTANCESVDMTVKSGHWRNIYVGAHAAKTVTGDCKAVISGVTVDTSIAISYKGIIQGDVDITVSDATDHNTMFACPNYSTGKVEGNVTITLGSNVTAPKLYLEGSDRGVVTGTTTVILDGENQAVDTITRGTKPATGGASTVILKSGRVVGSVAADTVSIRAPQGKTLLLDGAAVKANSASGAVSFRGSAALTAEAVEGTLSCTVTDTPLTGHVYVSAPAGSAVSFPEATDIKENNGQWTVGGVSVDVSFQGLVLMAKPDVTVKLYTGFTDGEVVTPVKTETGEFNSYYYELEPGNYRYISSGTGYYKIEKNLYMSDAKLAKRTVVDATPPVMSGEGWEQKTAVKLYTDEVYNGPRNEDISQWPDYADVFTTPYFTEERTAHQMTTQSQLEAFIHKLDDEGDNLYIFSAGRSSGYDFDLPVVVVTKTDLSDATTLEEAAQLVGQDKPTIFYRAHMHGSEPASAEGALAILQRLDGALGDKVLDKINLVVMPRNNPDGASTYTRNLTSGVDPNSDLARVVFSETEAYLRVFDQFAPELVLDGHEYTTSTTRARLGNSDALIGLGFAQENSREFINAYRPMDQLVRDNLTKNGLYYRYYESVVNHNGPQTSRSHAALQGTMFVLIESQGIHAGTSGYHRRVITHVVAMQTMIEYVAENAALIQQTVDAERQRIVSLGSTYEESDQVLLELDKTADDSWQHPQCYIYQDGRLEVTTATPKVWNTVLRSRTAPTAYVIPAGESYTAGVLALMDKHHIAYTFVPAGAQISLQQYSGTVTADSGVTDVALSPEKTVTFGNGAYVLCKNQVKGLILSALMEPDVTKFIASNSGIVLQGLVPCQNGSFPIYRYCHDLNEEGFVDYTVTQVKPLEMTVWLDGTNGLDTGDGLTEATAVKTLTQAYAILEKSLHLSPEGSCGTVKLVGLYDLGNAAFHFPAADYPVIFTGKTGEDGFTFKGGSELSQRHIYLNGDTTFQNMRLHSSSAYTNNFIFANGYKLVMGKNLNTTCTTGKYYYFTLLGGSYDYGQDVASTSITVESGTWRMIYCGGYRGNVLGTAKVVVRNATLFAGLYASYVGNVNKLEVDLSHTQVTNEGIFAGTYSANSTYKLGFVQEGSTLTLGQNVTAPAVYCSGRVYGSITGGATVVAAGVDLSQAPVKARFADLSEKYGTDYALLQLAGDVSQAVTMDPGVVLDLNGHNVTGHITVDGTLQVKDSQTDDFTVADGVYGKLSGAVTGTLAAAPGYVALKDNSFHRFGQTITCVAIRPSEAGIYYTGRWNCDEVLAANIASFGVAVSLKDMPGTDFRSDLDTLWTAFNGSELVNGAQKTSAIISGILKEGKDNDTRGKTDIYAVSYVILTDGTVLTGADNVAYSLYDVMHLAEDTAFETNQEALNAFYNTWKDVMASWDFEKIGK